MIAIVGYIKVDESNKGRVVSLIACIRSYLFLKGNCEFILGLHSPSKWLYEIVYNELKPFNGKLVELSDECYGRGYSTLLSWCKSEYVINFMEDQFMVCDDTGTIEYYLNKMKEYNVDVLKSSFWIVEQNSCDHITDYLHHDHHGELIFINNKTNFTLYSAHYKRRFYIGCNFITPMRFAKRFWMRGLDLGPRPHKYEISSYDPKWIHTVMIPGLELQAPVEDDHGEPGTCLIKRGRRSEKWDAILEDIVQQFDFKFPHDSVI